MHAHTPARPNTVLDTDVHGNPDTYSLPGSPSATETVTQATQQQAYAALKAVSVVSVVEAVQVVGAVSGATPSPASPTPTPWAVADAVSSSYAPSERTTTRGADGNGPGSARGDDSVEGACVDPQAWVSEQLLRQLGGSQEVNPYAVLLLRAAGFAPAQR